MRIYRTASETLAMCDYRRAKRTDPTPMQRQAALANWRAEPLLTRIAHLFRVNRESGR
ncbi:MAG: hypothetical protein LC121_01765 [Anaerolineae bacterium]|nr:hypothetical protein [Anaerolineae bacterium]